SGLGHARRGGSWEPHTRHARARLCRHPPWWNLRHAPHAGLATHRRADRSARALQTQRSHHDRLVVLPHLVHVHSQDLSIGAQESLETERALGRHHRPRRAVLVALALKLKLAVGPVEDTL